MTPDLSTAVWRKSSYSDGGGTNCVEVADGYDGLVPVRDSKVPDGPMIVYNKEIIARRTGSEWAPRPPTGAGSPLAQACTQ
ncbi:DUF397 domain-containing protein [Streptomyces avermitilis]|uniref:DUF397 domain-containing protein n=1 Tax=Streptomyces avermitilis TaxID=33903 RepID=UPI0033B08842